MRLRLHSIFMVAAIGFFSSFHLTANAAENSASAAEEIATQRQTILDMAKMALENFYEQNPEGKAEIEAAVGYGVFDLKTLNALVVVAAKGNGVIFDNATQRPTFMKAARLGTGPGVGLQKHFKIFVFKSDAALAQFQVGEAGGGDLTAGATAGTAGKEISFNPFITIYELHDKGFAIQANWGGTVYRVDPDLN